MDDLRPCPDPATANPADVLYWLAKKSGRELPREWVSMLRNYYDEPVDADGNPVITIRL